MTFCGLEAWSVLRKTSSFKACNKTLENSIARLLDLLKKEAKHLDMQNILNLTFGTSESETTEFY